MRNILYQILKTLGIYLFVFVFMYFCNMVIACITNNSMVWFVLICVLMVVGGILLSLFIINSHITKKENLKNIAIHIVTIWVLLILIDLKSYNQIYYPISLLRDNLGKVINEDAASFFSRTIPVLNTAYFLIASIFWGFYTLTRTLIIYKTKGQK